MGDPEHNPSRRGTNTQYENWNNISDGNNNQSNSSSIKGKWGEIVNTRSNTIKKATRSNTSTYYNVDIKTFGSVLVLRYDKVDLKKPFDIFQENMINYGIN